MHSPQSLRLIELRKVVQADGRAVLRALRGSDLTCRTRDDAEQLADLLSACLAGAPHYRLGLVELLLNAIEHGNLEIGRERKGQLLREQRFEAEIAARMAREPYAGRRAHVVVREVEPVAEIEIRDEGPGFAWRAVLAAELATGDDPNGRGIALIRRTCFPDLEYRDPGNVAIVRLVWPI
jgi:anti-sigma regulatory factor (Ser/Thr protein kinase)